MHLLSPPEDLEIQSPGENSRTSLVSGVDLPYRLPTKTGLLV